MDIKAFLTICIFVSLLAGESNGHTVCGKIGQDLYLHLQESNGRSFHDVEWKHDNISITTKNCNNMIPFAEVFENGTLKLYKVRRCSRGVYNAFVYDHRGMLMFKQSTHLTVTGESCHQTVYGKMGEDIYLHLQKPNGSSLHDVRWVHEKALLAGKNYTRNSSFANILGNGSLKLHKVQKNYCGLYTTTIYNDQGHLKLKESTNLVVIDPPVVELVVCTSEVTVLHCAGENGPDAGYEWSVSVLNQGLWKVSNYTGKYVFLNNLTGIISCSLKKGTYFSRSDAYFLSCTGPGPLVPDMNWCLSLEFTVLLLLLCFMTCGISVAVQICRKLQNPSEKSEQDNASLVRTQDDAVIYSEVRVGIQQK